MQIIIEGIEYDLIPKASKQHKQGRIEVKSILNINADADNVMYELRLNKMIPPYMGKKAAEAIESVLNNDTVVEDDLSGVEKHFTEKRYTQSEVDTIRREEGLYWFREGYKYSRSFTSKIPYDKIAELTVVNAFNEISSLNSKDTGKDDIRDNKINLLEEDLWCVHKYLDDLELARVDKDGKMYSIVGRIKELGMKWMRKISEIESEYLSKQQPTNDNAFVRESKPMEERDVVCPPLSKQSVPPIVKDKEALFTTEDGVKIYDYSKSLFAIVKKDKSFYIHENFIGANPSEHYYFSTKEAAEQYIIENKPCLSVLELFSCYDGTHYKQPILRDSSLYIKLIEKVKQKLKQ